MQEIELPSIDQLVKTELPPLSSNILHLSTLLADLNVSQQNIAAAIGRDPVLSARILRLANSPLYCLQGRVTNVLQAVSAVGNTAISDMIMITGISDSFGRKILSSAVGQSIWRHLLATAMSAAEISRAAGMRGAEEAFSCGLLHDIGKLIFLRADAPFYIGILEEGAKAGDLKAVEKEVFGFDHGELGADAAVSWGLPNSVCHMIRFHDSPSEATAGVAMAHMINIADTLVTLKTRGETIYEPLSAKPIETLGLNILDFEVIWAKISSRMGGIMASFT